MDTRLATTIASLLTDDRAISDVNSYFSPPDGAGFLGYTGRHFERLGGGGDRDAVASSFTAEDLLAVQMLSVSVPAEVAVAILEGELGARLAQLLTDIPTGVSLGSEGARELIGPDSPADQAWCLLDAQTGVGWVTAGKLLSRKRPHLIPVYDDVVRCALGHPEGFWLALHDAWPEVAEPVAKVRKAAGVSEDISDLRILDVVVWMAHEGDHRKGQCVSA